MARRPRLESDEAFRQRLISEGVPHSKIQRAIVSGDDAFPRRAVAAPKRSRPKSPIQIDSENQALRESAAHAARVRDGAGRRQVPSASRTSGASTVNLSRSSPRPAPRAKAMSRTGTGSVPARKASGGPLVRSGSGGLSLRGGTRGNWRRDSKGRFA